MRSYLVVVRTTMDELPILLTKVHQQAYAKTRTLTLDEVRKAADLMGVDYASLCNVSVVVFKDGIPVDMNIVREIHEDELPVAA